MRSASRVSAACLLAAATVFGSTGVATAAPAESAAAAERTVSVTREGGFEVRTFKDGSRMGSTEPVRVAGENGVLGGSFTWWVEIAFSKYSREWTTYNSGTTTIHVNKVYAITDGNPCKSMNFQLLHWKGWYWGSLGTKTANGCNGAASLKWSTAPGEFKFEASTGTTGGPYIRGEGVVFYP